MMVPYLINVLDHCPSLFQKSNHNPESVKASLENSVQQAIDHFGLANEEALLQKLISEPFQGIRDAFKISKPVYLFYLINSLGEYGAPRVSRDELGRLKYETSVQKETGITNNLALELISNMVAENPALANAYRFKDQKSCFFLSHDIDSVYGSTLQDGLWAVKKGRIDVLFKLFANAVMQKPDWLNMDLIMKTESEYDFRSAFYWLVNKGKIDSRQTNSDYDIRSKAIIEQIANTGRNGFEIGLHKSISGDSFQTELQKLAFASPQGNRYHYLKFSLPAMYDTIESSGLKMDASLGFAEHYGFRNNYGYPFHPYNLKERKHYSFVEVPLNVMDGTFQRYMKIPVHKTADTIIGFMEDHQNNCLLSILWHNTFFSNYKYRGYLQEYKKILAYLYEQKFQNMNQSGIIKTFSWKAPSHTG